LTLGFFPAQEQEPGSTVTLLAEPDGSRVERTVLPSGFRVISEFVPGAHSVTAGVWAGVGSRDEDLRSAGAAHFLEHLLFKGTGRRSALEISASLDAVGGEMNAFTSKEYTCFYAKTLGRDLQLAVDVLLDITTDPAMRDRDIDSERQVVLEEIGMHDDDPADRSHERLFHDLLGRAPLARPILGTRESIGTIDEPILRSFFNAHYEPQNLVLAVAGDVDHRALVEMVEHAVAPLGWPDGTTAAGLPVRDAVPATAQSGLSVLPWAGEQCAVSLGSLGVPHTDPRRRALDVLNTALGGGMSSRLFQRVREERGLAYSVYSFHSPFSDIGIWGVAAGCGPSSVTDLVEVVIQELESLATDGLSDEEITRAKGHLSGSLVLAGEDTAARMTSLGRAEVATGQLFTLEEALHRVEQVTRDDLDAIGAALAAEPRRTIVVGPQDQVGAGSAVHERLQAISDSVR